MVRKITTTDIEKTKTELIEELQDLRDKYNNLKKVQDLILSNPKLAFSITDLNGNFIEINEAMASTMGIDKNPH